MDPAGRPVCEGCLHGGTEEGGGFPGDGCEGGRGNARLPRRVPIDWMIEWCRVARAFGGKNDLPPAQLKWITDFRERLWRLSRTQQCLVFFLTGITAFKRSTSRVWVKGMECFLYFTALTLTRQCLGFLPHLKCSFSLHTFRVSDNYTGWGETLCVAALGEWG